MSTIDLLYRSDTLDHVNSVKRKLEAWSDQLKARGVVHDASKFDPVEAEVMSAALPKLRSSTYGSDEYKTVLTDIKPATDHHYAVNRHHPEYHPNGVNDMTLLDIVEMLADWMAATERHDDGDIRKSLDVNRARFGLSDQLHQILVNTVNSTR